jgi:hypothetical protein
MAATQQHIVRLYETDDGESHFQDVYAPIGNSTPLGFLSESIPAKSMHSFDMGCPHNTRISNATHTHTLYIIFQILPFGLRMEIMICHGTMHHEDNTSSC